MPGTKKRSQIKRTFVLLGAMQGTSVWVIYAAVECWFLAIMPWFLKPHYDYIPLHLGFTLLLFGIYSAVGLILGGVFAFAFYGWSSEIDTLKKPELAIITKSLATVSVILAIDANLILQWSFFRISKAYYLPPLSISLLLAIALVFGVWSKVWFKRLRFAANPLTTSLLLLGLPWVTVELVKKDTLPITKAWLVLAYLGVVLCFSIVFQKIIHAFQASRSTESKSNSPDRGLLFKVSAALFILVMSAFLHQEPQWGNQKVKPTTKAASRPNVILITLDTVRADHLSLYGYKRDTTPNLRKFSKEAILYTHAIAPGDMTLSTHASIFTGLYSKRHGAHWDFPNFVYGRPLADKIHTLSEILSDKGYLTMGVVANLGFLSHKFGLDRGFYYYDNRAPVLFFGQAKFYSLRRSISNILACFASPSDLDQVYFRAEDINKEVFNLLDNQRNKQTPFFLFVNYMDAHAPYIPPAPFDAIYPGKDKTFTQALYHKIDKQIMMLERKLTEEEGSHLISQYDGSIAYIDFHIGKLISRLKEIGLYENCLIIITSDHGEAFGEKDLFEHGVSVYQDQINVPLIIKYPDSRRSTIVDDTVSLCDLMPSVLDVLGFEIPVDIDGQSLLRLKHNESREIMSESYPKGYLVDWHPRFRRIERAIFSGRFKFINSTAGKRELYDLSKDLDEKENLYGAAEGTSRELEAKLNRWLRETKEESGSTRQLDKGTLDRLKSLGYIK
jgi:arylsulfatase A-like enzyme